MRRLFFTLLLLFSVAGANEKGDVYIGINGYLSSLGYELCGDCEHDDAAMNIGLEVGRMYDDDTLLNIEFDTLDWKNADLDILSFSYEHLYGDIEQDDYTLFAGVDIGFAKFENSVDTDWGTALGIKGGVLYPLSLQDALYLEGIIKYKRFYGLDAETSGTCSGEQRLKSLGSIGIGLKWFL